MAKEPVSFIGLGAMGFGMATTLIKKGYEVTGFDVWAPTLERFKDAGGIPATSPAETVANKPYCVCMVATAKQAQAVLLEEKNAAVPALPKGAVLLLCSTVPAGYVQGLANQLKNMGRGDILLVDCPVSGGAARAATGELTIMAGAPDEAIAKGRDLLQAMSDPKKLFIVKGGIGAGSNMKMVHQVLAACQILSSAELMGFADVMGLNLEKTRDTILASDKAWIWMFENRVPRILHPEHKPLASAITIILKDAGIITSEARRANFPTPMVSTAEQVYISSLGRGMGGEDDSALIKMYNAGKGTVPPSEDASLTEEQKLALVLDLAAGIHLCSAAESLSFAHHCGLDLDQVFELCVDAAGGSKMLTKYGPIMMEALRGGNAAKGFASKDASDSLQGFFDRLNGVVAEGQRLRCPLFLGTEALNLLRIALRQPSGVEASTLAPAAVIKVWSS